MKLAFETNFKHNLSCGLLSDLSLSSMLFSHNIPIDIFRCKMRPCTSLLGNSNKILLFIATWYAQNKTSPCNLVAAGS